MFPSHSQNVIGAPLKKKNQGVHRCTIAEILTEIYPLLAELLLQGKQEQKKCREGIT